jgi:hypothetical protein
MNKLPFASTLLTVLIAGVSAFAGEDSTITTKVSGYASFEAGQVMNGFSSGGIAGGSSDISHGWVQKAEFGLYADVKISGRFHIIVGPEAALTRSFKTYPGASLNDQFIDDFKPKFSFSMGRAEGMYTFGDPERALFQLEGGYFSYKYDQDSRNFGEYLFRTGAYPPVILNKFDRPFAYLLGFRAGNTLRKNFHHDLLLTSEITEFMGAQGDFSLSYCADYQLPGMVKMGGGISLYRVFPLDGISTTPHSQNTFMRIDNAQWTHDTLFHTYNVTGGDSVFQSYAGTKLMGQVSFDIAGLIKPFTGDLWKSGDIILYSEIAILGVKNYTAYNYDKAMNSDTSATARTPVIDTTRTYYSKLKERMPLMFGFTFRVPYGILDVVNCELEYLDSRYPNNFERQFKEFVPLPNQPPSFDHEKLKWSFYAKKCLGSHASIIGQIANDHFVPTSHSIVAMGGSGVQDMMDVLLRHGDWWWVLKMKFNF